MMGKGLGCAFLSKMFIEQELEEGTFIHLPLQIDPPPIHVMLLFKDQLPQEIKNLVSKTTREIMVESLYS